MYRQTPGRETSLASVDDGSPQKQHPTGPRDARPIASAWYPVLVVFVAALLAMAPELTIGLTVTDSYRFNLLWPDQFGDAFRAGHWYPRWLPLSWGGLGSPNFYFYPPLFFWVTSAFDTITRGALGPEQFVTLGTLTLLATSGLCMRSWLLVHVSRKRALAGGVAYVLAPYHLYDIYARGALAEASAYASVPLIMLALARLSDGRRGALPLLSVAYAAVLFSHLPTALLVSLFLIAPYVTFLAATSVRPLRFVASSLTGGLVGIGLAAIYLVPALTLLTYVSARALSGDFYRPDNWFFWHIHAGLMSARMYLIVPVTLAAFALAAQSVRAARGSAAHRSALFWAALTIFLTVIIAGVVPGVWHLPGLKLVQFPWRALLLVEFTTITMLTLHFPRLKSPMALCAAALLAFAYCVLALMIGHTTARTQKRQEQTAAEIRAGHLDAPEYLPAGTKIVQGQGPTTFGFNCRSCLLPMPIVRLPR